MEILFFSITSTKTSLNNDLSQSFFYGCKIVNVYLVTSFQTNYSCSDVLMTDTSAPRRYASLLEDSFPKVTVLSLPTKESNRPSRRFLRRLLVFLLEASSPEVVWHSESFFSTLRETMGLVGVVIFVWGDCY